MDNCHRDRNAQAKEEKRNQCLDGNKLGYGSAIVHSTFDFALLTVTLIVPVSDEDVHRNEYETGRSVLRWSNFLSQRDETSSPDTQYQQRGTSPGHLKNI